MENFTNQLASFEQFLENHNALILFFFGIVLFTCLWGIEAAINRQTKYLKGEEEVQNIGNN